MNSGRGRFIAIGLALIPLALLWCLAYLYDSTGHQVWMPSSATNPLGTDEFGRDTLGVLAISILNSISISVVYVSGALVLPVSVAILHGLVNSRWVNECVVVVAQVIDSVPIFFWVLAAAASVPWSGGSIVAVFFAIAVFPIACLALLGEIDRLEVKQFVLASRALGCTRLHIFVRHIVPNSLDVLYPIGLQLFGIAIAMEGILGVVGFGSRADLDLGSFLFRSKELIATHPNLMIFSLGSFFLCYVYIIIIKVALPKIWSQEFEKLNN